MWHMKHDDDIHNSLTVQDVSLHQGLPWSYVLGSRVSPFHAYEQGQIQRGVLGELQSPYEPDLSIKLVLISLKSTIISSLRLKSLLFSSHLSPSWIHSCLRINLRDDSVVYQHVFCTSLKMSLQLSCKLIFRVPSSVWIFSSIGLAGFICCIKSRDHSIDSFRVNLQLPLHCFSLSTVFSNRVNTYNLIVSVPFG